MRIASDLHKKTPNPLYSSFDMSYNPRQSENEGQPGRQRNAYTRPQSANRFKDDSSGISEPKNIRSSSHQRRKSINLDDSRSRLESQISDTPDVGQSSNQFRISQSRIKNPKTRDSSLRSSEKRSTHLSNSQINPQYPGMPGFPINGYP